MKKGLKITALCLSLIITVLSLASCSVAADPFAGGGISYEQLMAALEKYGNDGDNINVTVQGGTEGDLLSASHAILSSVSVISRFSERRNPTTGKNLGEGAAAGSGIIYKLNKSAGDAYIVTNYHVVFDEAFVKNGQISDDIKIYLYGQEYSDYAIEATYVGGSMKYDVAVLRVTNSEILRTSSAMAASFANSDLITPLERAIAIGNPNGEGIAVTSGIISVTSEYIDLSLTSGSSTQYRVIRTDAAINSGNSGGGLFNARGEVIGIIHARANLSYADNVGYAIPGNLAKAVVENILDNCDGGENRSVLRCLLGIMTTSHDSKAVYDTETGRVYINEKVRVAEIVAGGKSVGKFKVGDIIEGVNIAGVDYPVTRAWSVADAMLNTRVGDTVTFKVDRGGEEVTLVFEITADFVVAD